MSFAATYFAIGLALASLIVWLDYTDPEPTFSARALPAVFVITALLWPVVVASVLWWSWEAI